MHLHSQLEPTDFFDQTNIDSIERAMERAWDVLQQLEPEECTDEGHKILALCVMTQARDGESNHLKLVNRAIVQYRAQRAHQNIETRRQRVQAKA